MTTVEKPCSTCHEVKPLTDYYHDARNRDGRQARCKRCANAAQTKKPTTARAVRGRAYQRALSILKERHEPEFDALYESELAAAWLEAGVLAVTPEAREHYSGTHPRLKTGKRLPGETARDRIDVARCRHCVSWHDRGHVCPQCGASPSRAAVEVCVGCGSQVRADRPCDVCRVRSKERKTG